MAGIRGILGDDDDCAGTLIGGVISEITHRVIWPGTEKKNVSVKKVLLPPHPLFPLSRPWSA